MNTETKKIALACFVGGVLCYSVAALCAPAYAWLGLIAGVSAGYFAYEFRTVVHAVPVAFRKSIEKIFVGWENVKKFFSICGSFLRAQHVIIVSNVLFGSFLFCCSVYWDYDKYPLFPEARWPFQVLGFVAMWGVCMCVGIAIVTFFSWGGAQVVEGSYWLPFFIPENSASVSLRVAELEKRGLQRKELTYRNFFRWTIKGFLVFLFLFPVGIVLLLCKGVKKVLVFFTTFLWTLFKLIHSNKRLLCAVDGTIGGTIAYVYLRSVDTSGAQHLVLALFGGLIGAGLGVLNWELISIRLLKLSPSHS